MGADHGFAGGQFRFVMDGVCWRAMGGVVRLCVVGNLTT